MGRYREDNTGPRLETGSILRGRGGADARATRLLAGGAALDAGRHRPGPQALVRLPGPGRGQGGVIDEAYKHKVKTAAEIAEMIGPPPRRRKIVMCHGTFDLVHPGHIRHLVYAHSKGAKLIVGVTADIHVKKADHRPFVPEGLRALNLAALETVDYVTIDPQATPIQNILTIRPDYFVKGYEYQKGGLHPRTAEEKEAVESYGGEVIFTPGDIVY